MCSEDGISALCLFTRRTEIVTQILVGWLCWIKWYNISMGAKWSPLLHHWLWRQPMRGGVTMDRLLSRWANPYPGWLLNYSLLARNTFDNLMWLRINALLFKGANAWWRHQMKTFSTLLAICAGNSLVTKASDAELWCFLWSEPE